MKVQQPKGRRNQLAEIWSQTDLSTTLTTTTILVVDLVPPFWVPGYAQAILGFNLANTRDWYKHLVDLQPLLREYYTPSA